MPHAERAPEQSTSNAADSRGVILIAAPVEKQMAGLADRILWAHRTLLWCSTCADTIRYASERHVEVVLSARDLDDGDWKLLLQGLAQLKYQPPLVVVSVDPNLHFRRAAVGLGAAGCISLRHRNAQMRPQ